MGSAMCYRIPLESIPAAVVLARSQSSSCTAMLLMHHICIKAREGSGVELSVAVQTATPIACRLQIKSMSLTS